MEKNISLKSAIKELEVGLLKLSKPTYDNIDNLMRKIMKKYDLTAKDLHYGFRNTHNNQTPDDWIKGQRKMKTFKEFIEEANTYLNEDSASYERRQANKKARGRAGKTSLYTTKTSGKVVKGDGGKLKVERISTKKISEPAQMGMFKAGRTGFGPGIQGGGHGGREMGYTPAPHSTGGIHRGKKKGEQTQAPEPRLNPYQRRRELQKSKALRTGGEVGGYAGLMGGRAIEKMKEKAKKSFGAASKSWSEKEKAPKKKSAKERMAAAAEKLGLKD
jgi:hypothetical protein